MVFFPISLLRLSQFTGSIASSCVALLLRLVSNYVYHEIFEIHSHMNDLADVNDPLLSLSAASVISTGAMQIICSL